jgi:two-component system, cell cycle sensor histidine kinase and response regulator CckA
VELRALSNILVVEPDPIVRNLIIRVLTRSGFAVFEAANLIEARQLCESPAVPGLDVLIADSDTADRDFDEQILRSCPDIKILHVSGWPYEVARSRREFVPGSSFLQKPFTASQLLDRVRNLLSPITQ